VFKFLDNYGLLGDIRVQEHPLMGYTAVPVLELSPEIEVSEAFRKGLDSWLLDLFGTRYIQNDKLEVVFSYTDTGDIVYVSPRVAEELRKLGKFVHA